jgi:hypothetical protein
MTIRKWFFIPRVEEGIKVAENSNLHKNTLAALHPLKRREKGMEERPCMI